MKKRAKKVMLSVLEKTVRLEAEKAENMKLPICPFIMHQPKRPKKTK